jgi:hypothetical protein
MSAVSQSYPNYLGGLNEQPDELKKPGQLVEALNVIPDPTIGLTRRPGFQLIPWTNRVNGGAIDNIGIDPEGSWFEFEIDKQYFGCVNLDGTVNVFDEDGVELLVKYVNEAIEPHKKYSFASDTITITDENEEELGEFETTNTPLVYFRHTNDKPLKYCVSKNNIIFTNPNEVPEMKKVNPPTEEEQNKYYSFINLKVIDTENYNYTFRRFFEGTDSYRYITDVELTDVDDVLSDYDKDLQLELQQQGPYPFTLGSAGEDGIEEPADVRVNFRGRVEQLKSDDGDGYRNEARYSWDVEIVTAGKGFRKGQTFKETLNGVAGFPDLELTFRIDDVNTIKGTANVEINPGVVSDKDADEILLALAQSFKSDGQLDTAIVVGNGIYLENDEAFSVSTSEVAVADVMNSQRMYDKDTKEYTDPVPIVRVNTVAELPVECYEGFIVEVTNSFDNKNNYYLRYTAESGAGDIDLTKADGFWEEIAKPYERIKPRNFTLPHMITAVKESETGDYCFVVSKMFYKLRSAGTAKDNPSMFTDEAKITSVNYYKNRLIFLTDVGTVITSQAGEINNLFLKTAISVSIVDPIDVVANSNTRVPIHGSSVVNNGMVLFGDSEQYMLTTNGDILSSESVNVTKVSNYTFQPTSEPIYLGANIGFISKGLTRFYEMTNLYERGPVDINERSQQIQMQFGRGFDQPVSSREQSMAVVYKRYEGTGLGASSPNMMIYRFRQENSQESSQTSWVKWQIEDRGETPESRREVKRVVYASLPEDKMFLVVADKNKKCYLWKMDSGSLAGLPANTPSSVPKFTDGWYGDTDGLPFKTEIQFPTIYAQTKGATPLSDVTANLTIHRVKLSTAAIGTYDLTIERKGYDTYKLLVEQTPADEYAASPFLENPYIPSPPLYGEKIETVPIYTRNKNLTLTMSTKYDAPLTLQSMTWEGDWNRPYYKSV